MSIFSVTPQGVITVDTSSIKGDFQEAYKGALGANLNLDDSTVQGQFIITDTKMLTTAQGEVVNIANSFSVYYATGPALDVAAAFFCYYRKQGIGTVVSAVLSGASGTVIPEGSLASNGTFEFALLNTVVIGTDGKVTAEFQCTESGNNPCLSGTLNTIVTIVSGWDSITNPSDGIQGYQTENDNEFRSRITANWLNIRARSILGAIVDNVAALPDVISVIGRENPGNTEKTIDGITLKPHSVYLCVLGGAGSDIAKVLAEQKTLGAGVNGDTTITYYDPEVDYNYDYLIQRPNFVDIDVQVQYAANSYTPADVNSQIITTLINWVAENPFKIKQTVAGNELAKAFNGFNQITLLSVKIRIHGAESWSDYVAMNISQVPVLSKSNIVVEAIE